MTKNKKSVHVAICLTTKTNCINVELENQLILLELDIIDNNMILSDEKYELKNLQLSVNYYKVISQFNVVSLDQDKVDIILGSP